MPYYYFDIFEIYINITNFRHCINYVSNSCVSLYTLGGLKLGYIKKKHKDVFVRSFSYLGYWYHISIRGIIQTYFTNSNKRPQIFLMVHYHSHQQ